MSCENCDKFQDTELKNNKMEKKLENKPCRKCGGNTFLEWIQSMGKGLSLFG